MIKTASGYCIVNSLARCVAKYWKKYWNAWKLWLCKCIRIPKTFDCTDL